MAHLQGVQGADTSEEGAATPRPEARVVRVSSQTLRLLLQSGWEALPRHWRTLLTDNARLSCWARCLGAAQRRCKDACADVQGPSINRESRTVVINLAVGEAGVLLSVSDSPG